MSNYQMILRNNLAKKNAVLNNRPVGVISLIVVGSGASGDPCSLFLFTDHERYFFNCGEGTQRLASEWKLKLSRVCNIFMTQAAWSHVGGLPGLTMSIRNLGTARLNLYGPRQINRLIDSWGAVVKARDLRVEFVECIAGGFFEDNAIRVTYAPLTIPGGTTVVSMCYAVRIAEGRLRIVSDACEKKGVPAPLRSQLKSGKNINLPDGTVVSPEEVTEAPAGSPSVIFLVVDVPRENLLDQLATCKILSPGVDPVVLIVHFTPTNIVQNDKYQSWMRDFPSACHLLLPGTVAAGLKSLAQQQHLHSHLPEVFPLLRDPGIRSLESEEGHTEGDDDLFEKGRPHVRPKTVKAMALLEYHLRPHHGLDSRKVPKLDLQEIEKMLTDRGLALRQNLRQQLSRIPRDLYLVDDDGGFPKISFLGTGAAVPSSLRNTSAILLEVSATRAMLLDCGEFTVSQIRRLVGQNKTQDILNRLQVIFLSHAHADHVLGILDILRMRGTPQRLYIASPSDVQSLVNGAENMLTSSMLASLLQGVTFVNNSLLTSSTNMADVLADALGVRKIQTANVDHGFANAFAVAVTGRSGWKITYSGDTVPCDSLLQLGDNTTLLIHEASFENGLERMAYSQYKRHSTMNDALNAARRTGARFLIMTHFSQRYARVPRLDELPPENKQVGVAFDFMTVTLSQLPQLPLLLPSLLENFSSSIRRLQRKASKRRRW